MISIIMPKSHRDTMEVLFVFLKWVASFAHMDEVTGSKMDLGNLATVICPSILYPRAHGTVRDESFRAIGVVTNLLENQDEFFAVPEEFLSMLHDQEYFVSCLEPGKDLTDFMKKWDAYQKVKGLNGRIPPVGTYNGPNGNTSSPRIAPGPTTPAPERPPPPPAAQRPYGMAQPMPSYPSSSSQHGHVGNMNANTPRTPQPEEWSSPRSMNPSGPPTPSRPSSYMQPRASGEYPNNLNPNNYAPNPSNYPPARQRTG